MLYKKKLLTALMAISLVSGIGPAAIAADTEDQMSAAAAESTPQEIPETGEQPSGAPVALPFTDIEPNAWYYSYVSSAYSLGIINGVSENSFSPESSLTGAEFLTMLSRADSGAPDESSSAGADSSESWYAEAIEWAEQNSILTDVNSFDPDKSLSREEMMVFLYRYLQYKGIEFDTISDLSDYTDSGEVSADALEAVQALVGEGIIEGDGATLRPNDDLSRAETAAILIRALDATDMTGTEAPDTPGFGGSGEVTQGTSANTIDTDSSVSDTSYTSTGDDENALRVTGNSASRGWGQAGANGAQAEMTADAQTLEGDIVVDTISTFDLSLTNSSEFTGTINIIDNEQDGTAVSDNAVVYIDEDSTWTLTGDCPLTSIDNDGTIDFNGYTITLADGTVLSE